MFLYVGTVEVYGHEDIARIPEYPVDRYGIDYSAVYQQHVVYAVWCEYGRHGDGGAYGVVQTPPVEEHFPPVTDVGGYCRERYLQILDHLVRDDALEFIDDLLAFYESSVADGKVHQIEDFHAVNGLHPFLEGVQASCRVNTADEGPHGGPRDGCYPVTVFFQNLYRPYVGEAPGTAAGQDQGDIFIVCHIILSPL